MDSARYISISLKVLVIILLSDATMADFVAKSTNLTDITWAHAVNSQSKLDEALKSDIQMIEADIIYGKLLNSNDQQQQPVMGHPPNTESDISLRTFLKNILEFNRNSKNKSKGVKLDFKSTEVFDKSLPILLDLWDSMKHYPVWINADIIKGPLNNTETMPVDPNHFIAGCKQLRNSTLSIGWTTRWGSHFTDGNYTKQQINDMISALERNQIINSMHPITFPVRAGIAAQSIDNLHELVSKVNKTNQNVTITVWSSPNDKVNIDSLRKLIFSFGLDRVYLDVPEEVSSQLHLQNAPGCASSLIQFGVINFTIFLLSLYFSNYQA